VPTSWIAPDLDKLKKLGYDCNCINANGDFRLSVLNQLGAMRQITEKDTAFYIQGDFDYDIFNIPVRGNVGVRYVKTDQSATGPLQHRQRDHDRSRRPSARSRKPFRPTPSRPTSRQYTNTLPSLNISAQPVDNFYVRFAAAKAMTRPQLPNLTPGYTAISQSATRP
jgi:iron complex outermembrane receptor protein